MAYAAGRARRARANPAAYAVERIPAGPLSPREHRSAVGAGEVVGRVVGHPRARAELDADRAAVGALLVVQVGRGLATGLADRADRRRVGDVLSDADVDGVEVGVERAPAVAVVDDDAVAVAAAHVAGGGDAAVGARLDGLAEVEVAGPLVEVDGAVGVVALPRLAAPLLLAREGHLEQRARACSVGVDGVDCRAGSDGGERGDGDGGALHSRGHVHDIDSFISWRSPGAGSATTRPGGRERCGGVGRRVSPHRQRRSGMTAPWLGMNVHGGANNSLTPI